MSTANPYLAPPVRLVDSVGNDYMAGGASSAASPGSDATQATAVQGVTGGKPVPVVGNAVPGTSTATSGLLVGGFDGTNYRNFKTDGNGGISTVTSGNVTSGSADSGAPIKVGGVFNTLAPTFTNGQRGDMQLQQNGALFVAVAASGSSGFDGRALGAFVTRADANLSGTTPVATAGFVFNGSTWDRAYSGVGSATAGAGLGAMAVEEAGRTFSNITTAATTTVKSGKGNLHTLTINTYVASATITIYDNTAASGSKIATITFPSVITSDTPVSLTYDLAFATGLTIVTSGAIDITVTYR